MTNQQNSPAESSSVTLLRDLRDIIARGRTLAYAAAGTIMLDTYWNIGHRIVEEEQNGKKRAEYGRLLLQGLAHILTADFGENYSYRNLAYYRKFYLFFPKKEILNARVQNLTWTHYHELLRVEDEKARMRNPQSTRPS